MSKIGHFVIEATRMKESNGTHEYGTDAHKLARAVDPETSHSAAAVVDTVTWEQRIHVWVSSKGVLGGTPKEALDSFLDAPYSTVTARFSALKQAGHIVANGKKRRGSAVLVDAKYAPAVSDEIYEVS